MSDKATRMRDNGRSWSEIAEALDISVAEAKERVQADKVERRKKLSQSKIAEDRHGLRDECSDCTHMRKEHTDLTGECTVCGPTRPLWVWGNEDGTRQSSTEKPHKDVAPYPWQDSIGCDEFIHKNRSTGLPWWHFPKEEDPQYVDPDVKLSGNNRWDAITLGIQDLRHRRGRRRRSPDMPGPSIESEVRRARKKLKAGKLVKKHRDRIKRIGY